jgi:hypothetical protein
MTDGRGQNELPRHLGDLGDLLDIDFRNVEQEVLYEPGLFNPSRSLSLKFAGS